MAKSKKATATILREIDMLTDRGEVMAKLARTIGCRSDAIYHGTRRFSGCASLREARASIKWGNWDFS